MKLKQDWFAVPHGEIYPKTFAAGTVMTGRDLERAQALGLIEDEKEARRAAKKARDEAASTAALPEAVPPAEEVAPPTEQPDSPEAVEEAPTASEGGA